MEKEDKITRLRICTVLELWADLQGEDLAPEEKFVTFVKTRLQAVDGVHPTFRFSARVRVRMCDTCCHSLFLIINLVNRGYVGWSNIATAQERLAQGILRRLSVWLNDPQGSGGPDSPVRHPIRGRSAVLVLSP